MILNKNKRPLVLCVPHPRTLELIFEETMGKRLCANYQLLHLEPEDVPHLSAKTLGRIRYVIGQPALPRELLEKMTSLKCIFNVEGNLLNNMDYDLLFERGVHVVTTGRVFARPVAELGIAMALNLARGVIDADVDFRAGAEKWGGDGNQRARLLGGSRVGIVGFGDLGRALARVLSGFDVDISVFDPWLPPSILKENGVEPADLASILEESDFIFVVAAVTSENQGFLDADAFGRMKNGAALILLSRAEVVDFEALMDAVETGHIVAASDVFPVEPLPQDHRVRTLKGFIRSAHRAGALDVAFRQMGEMVLEDLELLDKGLPPMRCKRAERETVALMRSRPVTNN